MPPYHAAGHRPVPTDPTSVFPRLGLNRLKSMGKRCDLRCFIRTCIFRRLGASPGVPGHHPFRGIMWGPLRYSGQDLPPRPQCPRVGSDCGQGECQGDCSFRTSAKVWNRRVERWTMRDVIT